MPTPRTRRSRSRSACRTPTAGRARGRAAPPGGARPGRRAAGAAPAARGPSSPADPGPRPGRPASGRAGTGGAAGQALPGSGGGAGEVGAARLGAGRGGLAVTIEAAERRVRERVEAELAERLSRRETPRLGLEDQDWGYQLVGRMVAEEQEAAPDADLGQEVWPRGFG